MSIQSWSETLVTAQVAGPVLNTFTTAVTCLPSQAIYTLPANWWYVGRSIRVTAAGAFSNVVTAQPTFTFDFRLGTLASPIVVFNGGAMTTSTTAHTNVPFKLEYVLTCRAVGSGTSANLIGVGTFACQAVLVSGVTADSVVNGHSQLLTPNTAPAVGTGFDSTIANVANLFVACGTSNASNGVTVHQYLLESIN